MSSAVTMEEKEIFSRKKNLERLQREKFDIILIGGGITGAGIARDASMRGLKVALVEAKDFASGTSSKSSKLLHGGLRYLARGQIGLIGEALREKKLHQSFLAPHLSKTAHFLFPSYKNHKYSLWTIMAGVYLYDAISLFQGNATYHSKSNILKREPQLAAENLKGGMGYEDAVMDDARICLENILSAMRKGAAIVNYVKLECFAKNAKGKIIGIYLRDKNSSPDKTNKEILLRGKVIINCTGPWVDEIRKLDNPNRKPLLQLSKGIHLLLPKSTLDSKNAVALHSTKDERIFFSIPWYGQTLIGTTDTSYERKKDGPLDRLNISDNEIDYLIDGLNKNFPESSIEASHVRSAFVGLRPLAKNSSASRTYNLSREYHIVEEESGLLSIAGGKYTTYRSLAEKVLKQVIKILRKEHGLPYKEKYSKCQTHLFPLVVPLREELKKQQEEIMEYTQRLGEKTLSHLTSRYGPRALEVIRLTNDNPFLKECIIPGEPDIWAECIYATQKEMALYPEDFLRRRTMLTLKAPLEEHIERVQKLSKYFNGKNAAPLTKERIRAWQHK